MIMKVSGMNPMAATIVDDQKSTALWHRLTEQAKTLSRACPSLAETLVASILQHPSFASALGAMLARSLANVTPPALRLGPLFEQVLQSHPEIAVSAALDLEKLEAVNPACPDLLTGFLSFRGFQGLQLYRLNHALLGDDQEALAVLLQNWGAIHYAMDIHPAARIGDGVFFDHGMGIVIGSTAVIEDGVNMWHGVTLGSTLTQGGDRHPKVRRNATVCAGATVLGNIEIGEGAIIAAGSVVLKPVAPGRVVAGVPAREVGRVPERLDAIDETVKRATTVQEG
ncbi:serine O-acetyltransferase EpsC [Cupriavidus sp. PET2-C1]